MRNLSLTVLVTIAVMLFVPVLDVIMHWNVSATATAQVNITPDAGTENLKQDYQQLQQYYQQLQQAQAKGNVQMVHFLWAALLAIAIRVAILFMDNVMDITGFGRKTIPLIATGLGLLVGILTKYAAGVPWIVALTLAGAGPGAVFFHEFMNIFQKDPVTPPADANQPPATNG